MIKKSLITIVLLILFSMYIHSQNEGWTNECKSSREIGNLKFTFPSEIDIDLRNHYIQQNLSAIKECLNLINETDFTDSIEVEFMKDRGAMKKYLGWPASGMAYPDRKTMFCIAAEKTPIKHEWMHMITMLKWGKPAPSLTWLNEGLATYADKCSQYSNEKIYMYLIQQDKLIETDKLVNDFYNQNDVISYFQAAYLVEYLLENYGVEKFKELWQSDIEQFNRIYNQSLVEMTDKIRNDTIKNYPTPVNIDWEEFQKGCY